MSLRTREGEAPGAGGTGLFWRFWSPPDSSVGLFLIHGLGEHSGRYEPLARWMGERGISLFTFDLRGHGRSQGTRGDAAAFQDLLEDVLRMEAVFSRVSAEENPAQRTRVLFGHSLGGLIALRRIQALPDARSAYAGAVLSAPWLATPVPAWLTGVGRILAGLMPGLRLPTALAPEKLTRDPEKVREWREDPLIHTRLTGRLFREVARVQGLCLAEGGALREMPLLFLVPDQDPVVHSPATLAFVRGIDDRAHRVEILLARRHEALNDLGREEVFETIHTWVEELASIR